MPANKIPRISVEALFIDGEWYPVSSATGIPKKNIFDGIECIMDFAEKIKLGEAKSCFVIGLVAYLCGITWDECWQMYLQETQDYSPEEAQDLH